MQKVFYFIAEELGYEFRNIGLLKQAFTRKSYSAENGGENNEILEFIGDKALDLAVIRVTTKYLGTEEFDKEYLEFKLKNHGDHNGKSQEAIFTNIKSELVKKKTLAKLITEKGYQQYLIMGKGDINKHIEEQESVKEDLFEAIIGAIAIDSDFDMDKITKVVERLIDFDSFFGKGYSEDNPVGLLQEWCARKKYSLPIYTYFDFADCFLCSVSIKELDFMNSHWIGKDKSKAGARAKAAYNAYKSLSSTDRSLDKLNSEEKEYISRNLKEGKIQEMIDYVLEKKIVTNFKKKFDSYNDQLITMADHTCPQAKAIISEYLPEFNYECEITVDELDGIFSSFGDTKEQAYQNACKELLNEILASDLCHK